MGRSTAAKAAARCATGMGTRVSSTTGNRSERRVSVELCISVTPGALWASWCVGDEDILVEVYVQKDDPSKRCMTKPVAQSDVLWIPIRATWRHLNRRSI
jgi:hypothetical protein